MSTITKSIEFKFKGVPFKQGISYEEAAVIVLQALRKEKRLNQSEMGKIIGLKAAAYNKLENNVSKLRLDTIYILCNHLNVTRKEFFSDIELVFETSNE